MSVYEATMEYSGQARLIDEASTADERTLACLMHAGAFGYLLGLPGFLLPLILWIVKKKDSPFLDDHGREAINFHISLLIYMLAGGALTLCGIGVVVLLLLPFWGLVAGILALLASQRGEFYRYPACIRLIG